MTTLIWIIMAASAAGAADSIAPPAAAPAKQESSIEQDSLRQLLGVRRIYVDRLTGGETAAQMRDLLVSSLENTKFFILTDNEQRADAFLRGGAEDLVFTTCTPRAKVSTPAPTSARAAGLAPRADRADTPAWVSARMSPATLRNASMKLSPRAPGQ